MKDIAASILVRLKNQAKETGAVKRMNIVVTVDLAGAEHKIDENNKVTKKRIATKKALLLICY